MEAITYLHTAFPRIIIHRDIKPENVLLDKNWNAKLSGLSIAITLPEGKTWIEDRVKGSSIAYICPEYAMLGKVSEYTDVYSFGKFMLVLLMGRPAWESRDSVCILAYAMDLWERGEPIKFGGDTNDMRSGQMKMFLKLALRCCNCRPKRRPKMILVAKELKLIERSLYCNVLETGSPLWSDNGGRDEEDDDEWLYNSGMDEEEDPEEEDDEWSYNSGRDEEEELIYG